MTTAQPNRGPAAGPANRAALIAAAREVFAEYGPSGPLALIAKKAGVGKGSLYRQFPTREDIIFAAFDDQLTDLARIAARSDATADTVLEAIIGQLMDSVGFLAFFTPGEELGTRLHAQENSARDLLAELLTQDRRGALRSDVTIDELLTAIRMFGAILCSTPGPTRVAVADEAWKLLSRALRVPTRTT